jgi:hypothetical protein
MLSVRVAAAGVVVASLSVFTVPAGACDFDRYQKKCDRELAARADSEAASERKSAKRVKVSSRRAKHVRLVKRSRAPRFAVRRDDGMTLASSSARMTVLLPESVLARRFRGFIDPRPVADNSFEALRKPHLVAFDLDAAPIVAPTAPADAMPAEGVLPSAAVTPKQDRAKPAPIQLASAESKPVTLAPAPQPAQPAGAAPQLVTAEASLTAAPPAEAPSRFSIHSLVLALCGALGAASALRFIVGA